MILLVADTSRNRDALAMTPMTARFSVSSRAVLAALRHGRDPGGSGIAVL